MVATARTPENTNLVQPSKFLLIFDRIPTVQYFCQTVNLPGIRIEAIEHNTPLVDLHVPGNKTEFNPLEITFLVDSKLQSWQEIFNWIMSYADPESLEERKRKSYLQNQFKTPPLNHYSDGTLTVLSPLNNPILRIQFKDAFPTTLTDIQFDVSKSAEDVITGTATFVYDFYSFLPL